MSRSDVSSTMRDKRSIDSLSRSFLEFARAECGDEPVYDAICRRSATSADILELLWDAPLVQQKPNLLLASIHDLVLSGIDDPLRDYFPSASGTRVVDGEFAGRFDAFVRAQVAGLRQRIATRATQTNEVGRCAVLEPCLAHLAETRGRDAIALLDFGASAGLNLSFDAFRYDYGGVTRGSTDPGRALVIPCEIRDGRPADLPSGPTPRVTTRLGIDRQPVDVHDDEAVRWLRACIWPCDGARASRFDRAVAVARANRHPVIASDDGLDAIERWLAQPSDGSLRVVFHSWVLFYFEPEARERFGLAMESLVARYDAVWLSAEAESMRIGRRTPAARGDEPGATAWIASAREGDQVRDQLLALSHPHGKWLSWRGVRQSEFVDRPSP